MKASDSPLFAVLNEIGIIEQLARNRFERAQADGLRLPQFTVLNHLARLGDGRGPAQIARAFEVTKATMTNTLQRLEERGFFRLDPDPEDACAKRVMLTEAGRARREAAITAVMGDLSRIWAHAGVTPEALLPGLRSLRTALDTSREKGRR